MAIDEKFLKSFEDQIDVLKSVEKAVQDAIGRANARLALLNKPEHRGKNIEDVLGPGASKQGSVAQSQGGYDHHR
jgi:hypothetical protein